MAKPRLFIDIDGVLLAKYALPGEPDHFQLRPYAGSFLVWASKHFDLYWLTCHDKDSAGIIAKYCEIIQCTTKEEQKECQDKNIPHITYAFWEVKDPNNTPNYDKLDGVRKYGGQDGEWFVLEDAYPCYLGYDYVHANEHIRKRWIICPDTGEDVLKQAHKMFAKYLKTGKLKPVWEQPEVDEIAKRQGQGL